VKCVSPWFQCSWSLRLCSFDCFHFHVYPSLFNNYVFFVYNILSLYAVA
jgi:hypothetical protein